MQNLGTEPIFCVVCGIPSAELWITGLPHDKVGALHPSGQSWLDLIPGDSVTLYLVLGQVGVSSTSDTVRTVAWAVTDSAVARISAGAEGKGTLVAIAPGVFDVTANSEKRQMLACTAAGCDFVRQIRVRASPSP